MNTDLETLYNQVHELIGRLDFEAIWKGFKPLKFALYNDNECFFDGHYIEKTTDFCANTAIKYNGEMIAIWKVQDELELPILASKMVHEMFHGYQEKEGWECFPNEMEALYKYNYSEENLCIKLRENKLLLELLDGHDEAKYQELLALRKYRSQKFPNEFNYESCGEDIEGSANYVEWQVLKQLDPVAADRLVGVMRKVMLQPEYFFPIRISGYYTGALYINATIAAGEYCYGPKNRPFIYKRLETIEAPAEQPKCAGDDATRVLEAFTAFTEESRRIVETSVQNGEVVLTGPYEILSVNVYDARRYGDYVTSRFFVLYLENGEEKVVNGDFVVKMLDEKTMDKAYRWVQE